MGELKLDSIIDSWLFLVPHNPFEFWHGLPWKNYVLTCFKNFSLSESPLLTGRRYIGPVTTSNLLPIVGIKQPEKVI